MWVTEHLALAYLLIIPFYIIKKKEIEPRLVLYIFIFANLIDATHIGPLRTISHNLIGTSVFTAFWLLFFYKANIVRKEYAPILIVAVASHVIGDFLFSGYAFIYPLENQFYVIFGWGTPEHMIAGSFITFIFLGIFVLSQDNSRLKGFVHDEEQKFVREFKLNKVFHTEFIHYYLFFAFRLFIIIQLILFSFSNVGNLSNGVWYTWTSLLSFILCTLIISTLPVKLNKT